MFSWNLLWNLVLTNGRDVSTGLSHHHREVILRPPTMLLACYITWWYIPSMIIKTKKFDRWARKAALSDSLLCCAVEEMLNGLIDADLGGGVYKKRMALPGRGKSGSVRTLLCTNRQDRWFFVLGFEKNDRANISAAELAALQALADDLLSLKKEQILATIADGAFVEVIDEKTKPHT